MIAFITTHPLTKIYPRVYVSLMHYSIKCPENGKLGAVLYFASVPYCLTFGYASLSGSSGHISITKYPTIANTIETQKGRNFRNQNIPIIIAMPKNNCFSSRCQRFRFSKTFIKPIGGVTKHIAITHPFFKYQGRFCIELLIAIHTTFQLLCKMSRWVYNRR